MKARRWCALAAAVAVVGLTGCSGDSGPERAAAPAGAEPPLADLENLLELRGAFNDDRGLPRLVLLLSPT